MPNTYYKAATYPSQEEAGKAFLALEAILHAHEKLDVSAYRYLHLQRAKWCVVVIGKFPSERFQKQFADIIATGEAITLEDTEIVKLLDRRSQQIVKAPYVRRHHKKGKLL